ncbi:hypothetical protein B484DRAFT_13414 [Ochromonadaceae sp. CCMP2298]|nr:hypothetical protein B484DRAFT_13414 [Ochromonadaceae sp. CCMP2298]
MMSLSCLLLLLVPLWAQSQSPSSLDLSCEKLCQAHNIIPSLWHESDEQTKSQFEKQCSKRVSQSCQAWSRYLKKAPAVALDWNKTCGAVFGERGGGGGGGGGDKVGEGGDKGGGGGRKELIMLTVANKPTGMFGMMVSGMIEGGMTVVVMGWEFFDALAGGEGTGIGVGKGGVQEREGKKAKHPKYFSGYKIVAVYLLLETCSGRGYVRPDQVLMFVDGTDSLFQRDQAYILSQVADMKKPILFSSERDMFPATDWVRKAYPKTYPAPLESAFMHLNTGKEN